MHDVFPTLAQWSEGGRRFAVATVVRTKGSAPRQVGSVMGVSEDGAVCGSVSGGCLDSAVVEACLASLKDGIARSMSFPQEEPHGAQLMCGGQSEVWIFPEIESTVWSELKGFVAQSTPCVLATRLEPFVQTVRRAGDVVCCSPLDAEISEAANARRSTLAEVAGEEWFFHVLAPRPRLVVIGAVHISRTLVSLARQLGFETIVIDPRTAFAQFDQQPDKLLQEWPQDALEGIKLDADTYAVALTHDPKIDDAAIARLIRSDVAYIGALGSTTTQAKRKTSLKEGGATDEQLARIHGPVGLDIGAKTPEEIALAVMAEIVKVRRGAG